VVDDRETGVVNDVTGTAASGRALVVTASNRAAAGIYPDRGGPLLAEGLRGLGFTVDGPLVVPDGEPVAEALRAAVREGYDVVLTTGGTGLSPTDRTPEATRGVLEREVPGLAEAIRSRGASGGIATAVLSRGLAGLAGQTLIVNLPGSTGGCKDGLAVLERVLVHAVDQIHGGDHAPVAPRSTHDSRSDSTDDSTNHAVKNDAHHVTVDTRGMSGDDRG
jgi:molybdenum cofactor synthesis domain-containing protein